MTDPQPRYTFADLARGACTIEMLGQPRVEPEPTIEPDADNDLDTPPPRSSTQLVDIPDMSGMTDAEIAQTSVRVLREATIEVFHRIGASDWLYNLARADPKTFLRMLQRLLPQSIEATVTNVPFEVPQHIRELSLDDLRGMMGQQQSPIIDVEYVAIPKRGRPAKAQSA